MENLPGVVIVDPRRKSERNIMRKMWLGVALIVLMSSPLLTQQKEYLPTCKMCPGTVVPSAEIQAYVKRGIANQLIDQQVRQVDIGKANVGVAVVYRGKLTNPQPAVAEHDLVSEVHHIMDGSATVGLGPDLVGKERRPAAETTVRLLNGPGNNAKTIRNGDAHQIKAGDVVVITDGTR